jgi:hypothetical protein
MTAEQEQAHDFLILAHAGGNRRRQSHGGREPGARFLRGIAHGRRQSRRAGLATAYGVVLAT